MQDISGIEQVTDQLNSGVILLDLELNIVNWNRFLAVHANQKLEQVKGKSIFEVFPELPKRWFERKVAAVTQLRTPSFCSWQQRHHLFELQHSRPITTDSHFMAQNCTFLPYLQANELTGICILVEDATDVCHYQSKLEQTMKELELATRVDGLTRIYNRKHWEEALANEFARARRYDSALSLIMFDLDHFKRLNDTYGHQCGDLVLIETASRVSETLRDAGVFGRYGGEEFAIILPETEGLGVVGVAERIRKALSTRPIVFEGKEISFSASIGISTIHPSQASYEELIGEADAALYQAKSSGRDTICLSSYLKKCS
jgi:diguanylate cyclase (GGDEF)-like protein